MNHNPRTTHPPAPPWNVWRWFKLPVSDWRRSNNVRWTSAIGVCLVAVITSLVWLLGALPATAENFTQQPAIEVQVSLGTRANELKFVPDTLEFQAGKRYKLVLSNPSSQKHYFTAKDFADSIWTQKVEAGKVEIKGAIHELELKPGAQAEWVFVPVKSGSYSLRCPIAGHTEAGMIGVLKVAVSSTPA